MADNNFTAELERLRSLVGGDHVYDVIANALLTLLDGGAEGPTAPVANAGADFNFTGASAVLDGTGSSGHDLTYFWEHLSGSGEVTIADPNSAVTHFTLGAVAPPPPVAPFTLARDALGVFENHDNDRDDLFWGSDLGRTPPAKWCKMAFAGKGQTSWSSWHDRAIECIQYVMPHLKAGGRLVLSIAPFPSGGKLFNGSGTLNLRNASLGQFNSHFAALALAVKNLLDAEGVAYTQIIWRIGWECNGAFYTWTLQPSKNGPNAPTEFRNAFRHFVTELRAKMPGAYTAWSILARNNQSGDIATIEAAYPGDAYVTILEMDPYGTDGPIFPPRNATTWQQGVQRLINHPSSAMPDLMWQLEFAKAHGLVVCWGEAGISWRADDTGDNDDPYYWPGVAKWWDEVYMADADATKTMPNGDPPYLIAFHVQADDAAHMMFRIPSSDPYYSPKARDSFLARFA